MKITKEEKMYLERCGYGRKDFAQIQEATRRDKTTYEMDGAPITRDEAVTRLGRLDYLSGIARSAFHFTAMRITEDGKVILFDSSRLFGKEYNINRSTANWSSVGCTFCCIFPGCSRFYFSKTPKISAGKGLFFCIKFSILNI